MSSDDCLDTFVENIQLVNSNEARQRYTGAIRKSSSVLLAPKVEHLPSNFTAIVDTINSGQRVCVILRGLPGSGKSFLAHQIVEATVKDVDTHILSADKYFINARGKYEFKADKLPAAHEHTQRLFTQRACQGVSPLIVDNTNTTYWEM